MCGLCGVYALDGPLRTVMPAAVREMNARIAHRGPDADGFLDRPKASLGHRRLAIIDVARGQQPLSNEDGTIWIVFNGEIYNYRSVRPALEAAGHRFRTNSDTETIVHAWEQYGPACVERLEGMFVFAIYDERRHELFIARDRLGKKPLYYTVQDDVLHFASELPALTASPLWKGELDLRGLETYLSLGYFLGPATPFAGVYKLPPAHTMLVRDGRISINRYWDVPEFDTDTRDVAAILDDVDATLGAAVKDRLESEVPLGAFLSGGIDSGLVVSYMAEALGERLVTTTVGFAQAAHNEMAAARVTARHVGSRHHETVIEPTLDEVLDAATLGSGEPLADSSTIPTWYVSRAARSHVTVALSGDGGDETFAGYDFRYVPHVLEAGARRLLPGAAGRRLARWTGRAWPRGPRVPKPLRAATLLDNLARDPATAFFVDLCFLKPAATRTLMGLAQGDETTHTGYGMVTDVYRSCPSSEPLTRAQYTDLHVYMPNDPLVKVDRMSMAHALEVRSPLLDRRVVELAFRIPASLRQRGRTGKWILRELAKRRLPAALSTMPKRGFTAPVGEWLAGPHAQRFADEVFASDSRTAGHIDHAVLKRWFEDHRSGRADHSYTLWAVWVLERWLRAYSHGGSPTGFVHGGSSTAVHAGSSAGFASGGAPAAVQVR
jgi:asparagine synthase (glutamine-hydrolysing)